MGRRSQHVQVNSDHSHPNQLPKQSNKSAAYETCPHVYIYIAMDQKPWDTVHIQILGIWKYLLVNVYITMENHHFEWKIWDLEIGFDPSRYFSISRLFPPKPGPVKESPHLDRRSIPRTEWGNSWELHHHFTIIFHGISWGFDIIMGWEKNEKASGNQTWLIMAGAWLISRSWCFSQIHQTYPIVFPHEFSKRGWICL